MHKSHRGFTLIELMIVVAIIGILAAVALPAYSVYLVRAQVVEAITLSGELKPAIKEFYRERGRFPANNTEAGLPEPGYLIGNYVKSIAIENGAMHVTFGNKVHAILDGKVLSLRPIVVTGSPLSPFSWSCGNANPPEGMESVGENQTNADPKALPTACRN